ncbi:Similar to Ttpal: Alpha-tocopherol transfer protein-like (Mus musculus) [Cotesia congregata]|uniref:Similar to Ttpal: Alpha-tocopherol transfer protein-like (Mus musculus) n=1 Tax=Cotesia congregata TaxID=51543 RepID=A0A8J2E433_COTCN|nr:Similar to Ttpal: Alpha-tocopherol transfer protein-like (Mus musculus) [Cotesia congregata]
MDLIKRVPLEEELKKNPELKEADLQSLREWCEKQPHLPKMLDSELVLFLHSNYYRIEPTKTTIDTFYTYWNMAMDLWMYTEGTMKGHIIVVDLAGLALGHTTRLSPMGFKKFFYYLQEGLPVRLKGFHFLNSIPVMDIIMGMMKPFLKKELMDILHIHTNNETAKKYLPLEILPNESGGNAGPFMELHKKHLKRLEDHRDFFLEEEKCRRIDESLQNYCDSLSRSSEEEISYCSFNLLKSHLGSAKSKVPSERKTILISDDTDQQFWAEDELSSQESRVQLSKRKRRRSLAHRNRTYRSRSRPNNLSSSSGRSVSRNPAMKRKKLTKKLLNMKSFSGASQPSSSSRSDRRKMSKIRIFKMLSELPAVKIQPTAHLKLQVIMALIKMVPVEEEMKRNPELKEADLKMLKDWYEKQPHLPKISDNELILFLHTEGYKIIYGRLMNFEPSAYVYNDAIKYWNMSMDLWMYSEGTMKGHIILVDLAGLSFGHTTRLSPMGLKKFLFYLQEGLPVRLKGLHFTNSIPVMEIILGMMKPFMKKELMDILHIHTSNETVKKFLPLDILPNESGGKAGPLRDLHEKNIKKMEAHRDFFLEEESRGRVNESLRPGKGKNATDLFGVEGSFKKLDID